MLKLNLKGRKTNELSLEEIRNILNDEKRLTEEELTLVVGGSGDDREEFTLDAGEIEKDIYGELAEAK